MAESSANGVVSRGNRRWSFAGCTFDERSWSLTVRGKKVAVETKPLELLRQLLLRPGMAVSKAELLDAIWPEVSVVEASLPTAVRKLRLAFRGTPRARQIIETVPRIGYRLAVPVEIEDGEPVLFAGNARERQASSAVVRKSTGPRGSAEALAVSRSPGRLALVLSFAAGLGLAATAPRFGNTGDQELAALTATHPINQGTAASALRKLDVKAIDAMLAAGWDPNTPFDNEGNNALNYLLNMCEWDRDHDKRQMLLMARTLIDGGNRLDRRNIWGDTPYSIAKADRYCGAQHPVTKMIHTLCYSGYKPLGDHCLAAYELASKKRDARNAPSGRVHRRNQKLG